MKGLILRNFGRTLLFLMLPVLFLQNCATFKARKDQRVEDKLMNAYSHWKGTPYRLGGDSKGGVDCSALIRNVYRAEFGKDLPRTTRQQINTGKKVRRKKLRPGDIVFFDTSKRKRWLFKKRRTLHAGIYVGDDKFMHASSSKGVIISELSNVYWNDRYIKARRVL